MNYNKSYLNKYDNNDEMEYTNDYIFEKKKNIQNFNNKSFDNSYENNDLIIFQNKVEELFLKLKFFNTNIKNNLSNKEHFNNKKIIESIIKSSQKQINIIDAIDNIIINLNKKIISQGQIRNKYDSIEFEF
jgi:hypothetical protein